jgi:hypothetical protein
MSTTTIGKPFRIGFFNSVAEADLAARRLLSAGFSKDELAIICPQQFHEHFSTNVPRAERPGSHAAAAIVEGSAVGAALGGIGLVAAAITTSGLAILPAAAVLIGGGVLAGGFSGLILRDGYGEEIGQYYEEAVRLGKIVVGVRIEGEHSDVRLSDAEHILKEAGAHSLMPGPDEQTFAQEQSMQSASI